MKKPLVKFLSVLLAVLVICTPLAIKLPTMVKAASDEYYTTEPFSEKRHYSNTFFSNFYSKEPGSVSNDCVHIKSGGSSFAATKKIENLENGYYIVSFDVKSSGGQKSVKLGASDGTQSGERFLNVANYTEWTTVQFIVDVKKEFCYIGVIWYTGPGGTWIKLDNITFEKVELLDQKKFNIGQNNSQKYVTSEGLYYSTAAGSSLAATANFDLEPLTEYTMYIPMKSTGVSGSVSIRTYNSDLLAKQDAAAAEIINNRELNKKISEWTVTKTTFKTGLSGKIKMSVWMDNRSSSTRANLNIDGITVSKNGTAIQGYVDNSAIGSADNANVTVEAGGFIGDNELKLTGTGNEYKVNRTYTNVQNGMYIVSGYFKSSGGTAVTKLFADGENTVIENGSANAPIDKWTYFATAVNVTDGRLETGISYNSDINGWLSVDGFKIERAETVALDGSGNIPSLALEAGEEYLIFTRYKADGVSEARFVATTDTENSVSLDVSSADTKLGQIKITASNSGLTKLSVSHTGGTLELESVGYRKLTSKQPVITLVAASDIKEGLEISADECGIYTEKVTPVIDPPAVEKYDVVNTLNNFELSMTPTLKDEVTYEKGGKITDSKIVFKTDSTKNLTLYGIYNGNIENGQYTLSVYIRSSGGQTRVQPVTNTGKTVATEVKGKNYNAEFSEWTLIQQQNIFVDENYLYFALGITQGADQWIEIDGFQIKKVGETGDEKPLYTYKETVDVSVENFTKDKPASTFNQKEGNTPKLVITNADSLGTWYAGGIKNLENGTYTLSACVRSTGGQNNAKLIANNGKEIAKQLYFGISDWVKVEIKNITVSDNQLAVGVWYGDTNPDHKLELKNVKLHLVGEESAEQDLPDEEYCEIITLNNAELVPTATGVYEYLSLKAGGTVTDSRMVLSNDNDFSATLYKQYGGNLPNGDYTVTAKFRSSGAHNNVFFKASSTNCIVTSNNLNKTYSDWETVELRGVKVTDGKLYVSVFVDSFAGKTFEIDGVQIKRLGKDPAVTEKKYESVMPLYAEMFTRDTKNVTGGTGRWTGETSVVIDGNLPNGSWYYGELRDLKDGTYTVRGYVKSTGGQGAAKLIANNGKELNIQLRYDIPDWVLVELRDVEVKDGKLGIGFWYGGATVGQKIELCGMELLREGSGDIGIGSEKYEYKYRINNSTWGLTYNKDYDNYNYYHLSAYGDDSNKLVIKGEKDRSVTFYKTFAEGQLENGKYTLTAKVRSSGGQRNASIRVNAGAEVKSQIVLDLSRPISDWQEVYIKNITVTNGYLFFGIFYNATADDQWLEVTEFEIRKVSENGKEGGIVEFPYAAEFEVPKSKLIKTGLVTLTSGGYNSATKLVVGGNEKFSGGVSYNMTDLPTGYYTLSAMVMSSGGFKSGHIFANSTSVAENEVKTYFRYSIDTWSRVEVRNIYISGGKILIGIWASGDPGIWAYIDDIKLEYQGDMKIMDYKGGEGPKYDVPEEEVIELIKPSENRPKSPTLQSVAVDKKDTNPVLLWTVAITAGVLAVAGITVLVILFLKKRKKKGSNAL